MPDVPYDELVARYGKDVADNIVRMLEEGYSPSLIRELDPWTGQVHWEYQMPYPTGNVNIWQVPVNEQGEPQFDKATWVGPAPAPPKPPPDQFLAPAAPQPVNIVTAPQQGAPLQVTPQQPAAQIQDQQQREMTLDELILQRAGGDGFYTWDQWNWFYEAVTGKAGPAPEDVGLQRNAAGEVIINGQARYNYATWKAYAFGGAAGGGGGGGAPAQSLLEQINRVLRMVIEFLVAGRPILKQEAV